MLIESLSFSTLYLKTLNISIELDLAAHRKKNQEFHEQKRNGSDYFLQSDTV